MQAERVHEREAHLLKDLTEKEVERFLSFGFVLNSLAGDKIVRKGDRGCEMDVILSGAVEAKSEVKQKTVSLAILGEGNVFG